MPLDPAKVALAVQGGLAAVCATCRRYWEGRDRGLPEPRCTSESGCGSPVVGEDFHDYDGPMTDFSQWCFICGDAAKALVVARGKNRQIGVCAWHAGRLEDLQPTAPRPAGSFVIIGALPKPTPPKSLARAIAEVEDYYAKKGS